MLILCHEEKLTDQTMTFSDAFIPAFWADFLSGLVLLVIATLFIPSYLRFRERPNLILRGRMTRESKFQLVQTPDKKWRTSLTLALKNRGIRTLERCNWEILIPKDFYESVEEAAIYPEKTWHRFEVNGNYVRIYGYLEIPVFSLEEIDFPVRIHIVSQEKKPTTIYYYFKTDMGQHPFYAWVGVEFHFPSLLKKLYIQ